MYREDTLCAISYFNVVHASLSWETVVSIQNHLGYMRQKAIRVVRLIMNSKIHWDEILCPTSSLFWIGALFTMTSSNGNIFHVAGHLCGEFTGPGEIPVKRPVTRSFDVFSDLRLNKRLSKSSWGWWFETLSRPFWRHCNVQFKDQLSSYMDSPLGRWDGRETYCAGTALILLSCNFSSQKQ